MLSVLSHLIPESVIAYCKLDTEIKKNISNLEIVYLALM